MSVMRVLSREPSTLNQLSEDRYDAVLGSLGFEHRCREIPAALDTSDNRCAIPFGDHQSNANYVENKQWFEANGWQLPDIQDHAFGTWVGDWLARLSSGERLRVAVDVSSMSRLRMAGMVEALLALPRDIRVELDFLYTPATFEPPQRDSDPPIFDVAPVSPYFAGWWNDLDAPLLVMIGLGYELELAASAIDALEPAETEVYVPEGNDGRYLEEIEKANVALLDYPEKLSARIAYSVGDPFSCFRELESRVERLSPARRLAIVPLGPKIFAVCALLAAALHPAAAQVIRVSAGSRQAPIDRRSDGSVYGLTAVVGPSRDEDEDLA